MQSCVARCYMHLPGLLSIRTSLTPCRCSCFVSRAGMDSQQLPNGLPSSYLADVEMMCMFSMLDCTVQVLVTRKKGSRASSAAPSVDASFSSGKSFIGAQHAEEERPFAEGPLSREDRSMTHEGILLHESPQVSPLPTHPSPTHQSFVYAMLCSSACRHSAAPGGLRSDSIVLSLT